MVHSVPASRKGLFVILGLSVVGMAASVYLSVLHWMVHNVPGHVSFCSFSDQMNCDTVALSEYSVFAGIPVAYWGTIFFMLLIAQALWGLAASAPRQPWGILSLSSASAVAVSVFLLILSTFVINAYCLLCITIYCVSAGLAGTCFLCLRQQRVPVPFVSLLLELTIFGVTILAISQSMPEALFLVITWVAYSCLVLLPTLNAQPGRRVREMREYFNLIGRDLRKVVPSQIAFGAWCLVGSIFVLGLLAFVNSSYTKTEPVVAAKRSTEDIPDIGHGCTPEGFQWIGSSDPSVTITEYSDYECPYCRRAHEIVREVVHARRDHVRLVHVQMPLDQTCNPMVSRPFHRHACQYALAAICAAEQSAFWRVNDQLFSLRGQLDASDLSGRVGLDLKSFLSCMQSNRARRTLAKNLQECQLRGLRPATPTFAIGGEVVTGLKDRAWWTRVVERQRANPPSEKKPQSN